MLPAYTVRRLQASAPVLRRGQEQARDATRLTVSILERQAAPMGFGNLAAQGQADTGAGRLGSKERHEEVRGVGQAGSVVLDAHFDVRSRLPPGTGDLALGLAGCVNGIAHKIY